jgi:hypothetical protein
MPLNEPGADSAPGSFAFWRAWDARAIAITTTHHCDTPKVIGSLILCLIGHPPMRAGMNVAVGNHRITDLRNAL